MKKLKLFQAPNVIVVRLPKCLREVQKSFAPLETDEEPDFHGYRRRRVDGAEKVYHLSEEEMDTASVCLAQGLSWGYIIRLIFSADRERPIMFDRISADKRKAATLYLKYLCRQGAKVREVRSGMTGMLRAGVLETLGQISAYHNKKLSAALG